MTVKQKTLFGCGVGAWSLKSLVSVEKDIAKVEGMNRDAFLAAEMNAVMAKVVVHTNQFILPRSWKPVAATHDYIARMEH